ncbi:hypothetical protein SUGI_1160810 [Cryptomeria japonica]|uniref:uncharacterized protein LOC131073603 n=1 Tax=Cryptomeria japonica TaxID=3369 RepID=UPI0024147C2E|nr:uncharacterized protein LOC131073603 [Cryptomeria japonica]GLJ54168.1 hypothetical protein SUGI_1160810 [Cryptomeria japonica]
MTEEKGEKVFSGAAMSVEEKIEQEQELRRRTRRRRWMVCCCGTSLATVLVVALVCVILAVTVFKVRNPKVIVKSVSLDQFQWNMDLLGGKFDLNVTLDMSLSVKNRNRASFKYGNSTAQLFYRGINCGEAQIPAGKVGADRTMEMNTTVTILADRVISSPHIVNDILSGFLPLSTSTSISGRVNLLNIFKHHAISSSFCNMTIAIVNRTIHSEKCSYGFKL